MTHIFPSKLTTFRIKLERERGRKRDRKREREREEEGETCKYASKGYTKKYLPN